MDIPEIEAVVGRLYLKVIDQSNQLIQMKKILDEIANDPNSGLKKTETPVADD